MIHKPLIASRHRLRRHDTGHTRTCFSDAVIIKSPPPYCVAVPLSTILLAGNDSSNMAGPNSRLADGLLIAMEEEPKVVAVAEVAQVVADDQWLHVMARSAFCFAAADGDEASSSFILPTS